MSSRLEKNYESLLSAIAEWSAELKYGAEWSGEISVVIAAKMDEELARLQNEAGS